MDNKPHRKLKITQKGLDALRTDRDRPKVKTQVKITKKGRDALKKEEIDKSRTMKRGVRKIYQLLNEKGSKINVIKNILQPRKSPALLKRKRKKMNVIKNIFQRTGWHRQLP